MISQNGYLAVEPFKNLALETKAKNAFATLEQKSALVQLKIVHGSQKFTEGTVYVHGTVQGMPYAREVYMLNNVSFILIPESEVRLHQHEAVPATRPMPITMPIPPAPRRVLSD